MVNTKGRGFRFVLLLKNKINWAVMRIVHVNTWNAGGAAFACKRLHEGLLSHSVDSAVLHRGTVHWKNGIEVFPKQSNFFEKVQRKLIKNRLYLHEIKKNDSRMEYYSHSFTNFEVEKHPALEKADIVHLHWVSDFVNFKTFFGLKKPIVWTIHDLNPFLGGLHYTVDESRVSRRLLDYDLKLRDRKHSLIKGKGIHFVFLAKWTYEEACRVAPWLANEKVSFIYNGINTDTFKCHDPIESRKKLGLPLDKKILLFISDDIKKYRKGFDFVADALSESFLKENNIYAIALGGNPSNANKNIHYLESVNDPSLLSVHYAAADLFLLPSRQDNLPNVMLESLLSGCPVLAFKTGGMNECLDETNGILCRDFSAEAVREGIKKLLGKKLDRKKIASDAAKRFNIDVITDQYLNLYRTSSYYP
jgi:glycosyltransferase involved in cell wall biosynthesis